MSGGRPRLICECGHAWGYHDGPAGDIVYVPGATGSKCYHNGCHCKGFVSADKELKS